MTDSMEPVEPDVFEKLKEMNPSLYRLYEDGVRKIITKNHDYAGTGDFYKNFRECEDIGVPAWKGAMVRLCDKWSRIKNFVKKPVYKVKDESFRDTVIDMANYLLLMLDMYLTGKQIYENEEGAWRQGG